MDFSDLEQRLGVNPFGKRIEVEKKPEGEHNIKIVEDHIIELVCDQYKCLYANFCDVEELNLGKKMAENTKDILSPTQIQLLFRKLVPDREYALSPFPRFITYLIQSCYDNTSRDKFVLEPEYRKIGYLCRNLKGSLEKRLSIDIIGNVGNSFGMESSGINFAIYGNALNYCGEGSENCNYEIMEDVGHHCGSRTQDCTFTTARKEVYEQLKQDVSERNQNKARLVDKDNNILEEVCL